MLDCVETAAFPGQSDKEIDRLLHMVVVGGGPTGIELRSVQLAVRLPYLSHSS
jgi:NADH dehydrogenase FAD-containing subunit